jgi:hypothetical protein
MRYSHLSLNTDFKKKIYIQLFSYLQPRRIMVVNLVSTNRILYISECMQLPSDKTAVDVYSCMYCNTVRSSSSNQGDIAEGIGGG